MNRVFCNTFYSVNFLESILKMNYVGRFILNDIPRHVKHISKFW